MSMRSAGSRVGLGSTVRSSSGPASLSWSARQKPASRSRSAGADISEYGRFRDAGPIGLAEDVLEGWDLGIPLDQRRDPAKAAHGGAVERPHLVAHRMVVG